MASTLSDAPHISSSHVLKDVLALSDMNHYAARLATAADEEPGQTTK